MSIKHLLRCSCGQEIPVEVAQAGQRVRCQCGAELEVPTLLELKRLPQADAMQAVPRTTGAWGTPQRAMVAGLLVTLLGLGMCAWFFATRPRMPDVSQYPAFAALALWESLKLGVDQPPHPIEKDFQLVLEEYYRWAAVGLAVAAVGALILLAGLVFAVRRRPLPSEGKSQEGVEQ